MKFTKEFREKAIELKEKGIHPSIIFKDSNYDIVNKQKDYAGKSISRWKKTRPLSKEKGTQKKLEYLEAQVAYLKAENDFLKQLPKEK